MQQSNPTPQPDGQANQGTSLIPVARQADAQYYLKQGKSLYQSYLAHASSRDLDAAVLHFQRAVELEPELADAYVQLATALWDQGTINLELAQFYCETALKLDPNHADAHLYLGYFLQRAGFLDEATQQYVQSIRKAPFRSARPRIALGNTLLKQAVEAGDNKRRQVGLALRGITEFATGCALLPLDPQTCDTLRLAVVSDLQAYTLTGLAAGLKAIKLNGAARGVYRLGAKLMPTEPVFFHLLGDECLYDINRPAAAVDWYEKAEALDPENPDLLKKLSRAYADSENTESAVDALNRALTQNEEDFDTLYQLAQLHTDEQAYFKALYYFKEAEKQRPLHPFVHSNMAYVLFKLEDTDGAFEKYKTALEYGTDPLWLSTVSQTLGTLSYQVYRDTDQALEYFQQAAHYNPENLDALAALGDLYFETNRLELAISAYKSVLQVEPDNAECYSNVGYILWQLDMNDAAVDAYLAAIHYDPLNSVAHNNLGVIHLDESGNPERALNYFQTAFSLNPQYTLACFNIGRAWEQLGVTLEAAEAYNRALDLNARHAELTNDEIQERLDGLFR